MSDQIVVTYLNNDGHGFAQSISVNRGTTLNQFLQVHGVENPEHHVISVNRQQPESDYQLRDQDRISVTPRNLKAAA
jgi:sulfur carrier protein ThiS